MSKICIIALFSITLFSCSAVHLYKGQERNISELAFLRQNFSAVRIEKIDQIQIRRSQQDFYLLPGKHTLDVLLNYDAPFVFYASSNAKRICFIAEKGKRYIVSAEIFSNYYYDNDDWLPYVAEFNSDKKLTCN